MGRLFGYGRVMVRGMGVGEVVLPPIEQPIRFRKAIEKARMASPTRPWGARPAIRIFLSINKLERYHYEREMG